MAVFHFKALQGNGTIAEGQLEAGGRQEAFRQIESRGLRPISLAEGRNGGSSRKVEPSKPAPAKPAAPAKSSRADEPPKAASPLNLNLPLGGATRISARMLENFTRLLSSLLAAGVPLSR